MAIFCLSALCSCSSSKFLEKTDDTNLEFWITEKVSMQHYELSTCTYLPGLFGGSMHLDGRYEAIEGNNGMLYEPEIHVVYTVTAYPDYADGGQYITSIDITDPEIYVYGLTMNSTVEEVSETMKKMGFKTSTGDRWTKNNCTFSFSTYGIRIGAAVTNKKGIVF